MMQTGVGKSFLSGALHKTGVTKPFILHQGQFSSHRHDEVPRHNGLKSKFDYNILFCFHPTRLFSIFNKKSKKKLSNRSNCSKPTTEKFTNQSQKLQSKGKTKY